MQNLAVVKFTNGSYCELDPHAIGSGWCAIAANVSMDSGVPKPVKAPQSVASFQVYASANTKASASAVPAGSIQMFQFQGAWYFSSYRRDWAAEKVGTHERVYWVDASGSGENLPTKIINGVSAKLGTHRPTVSLAADVDANSAAIQTHQFKVTATQDAARGSLKGDLAYRIGMTKATRIDELPAVVYEPGAAMTCRLEDKGYVEIEWPTFATNNIVGNVAIYGRDPLVMAHKFAAPMGAGWQSRYVELMYPLAIITDPSVNKWVDTGAEPGSRFNIWPDGSFTTIPWSPTKSNIPVGTANPDDIGAQSNSYSYTFYRKINGHLDEGGMAPPVTVSVAGKVTLKRVAYEASGPFRRAGFLEESATNLFSITPSVASATIASAYDDPFSDFTFVVTDPSQGAHLLPESDLGLIYKQNGLFGSIKRTVIQSAQSHNVVAVGTLDAASIAATPTLKTSAMPVFPPGAVAGDVFVDMARQGTAWYGKTLIYRVVPLIGRATDDPRSIALCATGSPSNTSGIVISETTGIFGVVVKWKPVQGVTHYGIWVTDVAASTTAFAGVSQATFDGSDSTKRESWTDTGVRNTSIAVPSTNNTSTHVFKVAKSLGLGAIEQPVKYSTGTLMVIGPDTLGSVVKVGDKTFSLVLSDKTAVPPSIAAGSLVDLTACVVSASAADEFWSTQWPETQGLGITLPTGIQAVQTRTDGATATTLVISGIAPDSYAGTSSSVTANHLKIPFGASDVATAPAGSEFGWRVYKAAKGFDWGLMAVLPNSVMSWVDDGSKTPGEPPDSHYEEDGVWVDFDIPPPDLRGITPHGGMLWGFSSQLRTMRGNYLRWTPVNRPDAWPEAFSLQLPFPPVRLASDADSLFVFGPDGIYRVEAQSPTRVSISKTLSEYGCIAPLTVQVTNHGIPFLSQSGLCLFVPSKNNAFRVVPSKLSPKFFSAPSVATTPFQHWWTPTNRTFAFAYLLRDDAAIDKRNGMVEQLGNTASISSPWLAPRSWFHDGKYYLYYAGDSQFANHGTLCIDFEQEDPRVTFLGIRPMDAVVTELGTCHLMLHGVKVSGVESGFTTLPAAIGMEGVAPDDDSAIAGATRDDAAPVMATWSPYFGATNAEMMIDTGPMTMGETHTRKKWRAIEFHGRRTVKLRVWSDDIELTGAGGASATATETPTRDRRVSLPRSCWGYALRSIITGDAELTALELKVNGMPGES